MDGDRSRDDSINTREGGGMHYRSRPFLSLSLDRTKLKAKKRKCKGREKPSKQSKVDCAGRQEGKCKSRKEENGLRASPPSILPLFSSVKCLCLQVDLPTLFERTRTERATASTGVCLSVRQREGVGDPKRHREKRANERTTRSQRKCAHTCTVIPTRLANPPFH
mmetsp:Transcript_2187/g.4612  ORF Transcript_2187/g.4612 Transcript_2187/m.4612 type:complete len:165 (-) Transcript_2187:296-790(-)